MEEAKYEVSLQKVTKKFDDYTMVLDKYYNPDEDEGPTAEKVPAANEAAVDKVKLQPTKFPKRPFIQYIPVPEMCHMLLA